MNRRRSIGRAALFAALAIGLAWALWITKPAADPPGTLKLPEASEGRALPQAMPELVALDGHRSSRTEAIEAAPEDTGAASMRRIQFRSGPYDEPLALTRIDVVTDAGNAISQTTDASGWVQFPANGITGKWRVKVFALWLREGNPPGPCPPFELSSTFLPEQWGTEPERKYVFGQRLVPVQLLNVPAGLGGVTFHAYDTLLEKATECKAAQLSQLPVAVREGLGTATHVLDLYYPSSSFDSPGLEVWTVEGAARRLA